MLLSHTAQREGELLSFLRGELALSSGLVKRLKWQNAFFLDGAPVEKERARQARAGNHRAHRRSARGLLASGAADRYFI